MTPDEKTLAVPDIVSPCCGAPLMVVLGYHSTSYYGGEAFVEVIECDKCYNDWSPTGVSNERNRMPDAPRD